MKGMIGLVLAMAVAGMGLPLAASEKEPSVAANERAAYPRIGRADIHLILLGRAATTWSDEQLSDHVFGPPPTYLDQFAKRNHRQASLSRTARVRTLIEERTGMSQFRIGALSISMPYPSMQKVFGMTPPMPKRFRGFGGYHEDDASASMRLMPYSFDTSSFVLNAPFLPCDGGWEEKLFGSRQELTIGYKIRNWVQPKRAEDGLPDRRSRMQCEIRIGDEKSARRIEDARHRGNLAIGVTVYARFAGEMDGKHYVMVADRVDVNFYKNEAGMGTAPHLGSVTLRAPLDPSTADASKSIASDTPTTVTRGLDLSDPAQLEACATMAALTQTMAEQATAAGVTAGQTAAYTTIARDLAELADVMAGVVDRLGDRMKPHVIRAWSIWGYCHGIDDDLLFGRAATKAAAACNDSSPEMAGHCINDLLRGNFDALTPAEREWYIEAARQLGY